MPECKSRSSRRVGNTPRMVAEVYAHVIPADDAGAALLVGDLYRSPRRRPLVTTL